MCFFLECVFFHCAFYRIFFSYVVSSTCLLACLLAYPSPDRGNRHLLHSHWLCRSHCVLFVPVLVLLARFFVHFSPVCSDVCPFGSCFVFAMFVRLFRLHLVWFVFFYCFCPLVSAFVRLVRYFSPVLSICADFRPLGYFFQAKTRAVVFGVFFPQLFFLFGSFLFLSPFFFLPIFDYTFSGFCPLGSFLQAKALAELVSKREADGGAEVLTAPNMSPTRIPQGANIKKAFLVLELI